MPTVDNLQDVVQVVDGVWHLEEDGVRTAAPYYDRVLSMGDRSWSDYQTMLRLTIHGFTSSTPGPPTYDVTHFGVAMRWRGHHTDGLQPRRKWYPLGAQGEFLIKTKLDTCQWRILFDKADDKPPRYADSGKLAPGWQKLWGPMTEKWHFWQPLEGAEYFTGEE